MWEPSTNPNFKTLEIPETKQSPVSPSLLQLRPTDVYQRFAHVIEMQDAIISAWMHDNELAVTASSTNNSLKRALPCKEVTLSLNGQSPKKRRVTLSHINANPQNMPVITKDQSPRKTARTPSPRKRGAAIVNQIEEQLVTPRVQPHNMPLQFEPPSQTSYAEALNTRPDEPEAPQPGSLSRRTQSDSDALSTSKRSASPVKRVAALQDVGDGIFFQELSDNGAELGNEGQKLFLSLRDLSFGVAVLPAALEHELLPELQRIMPYQCNKADSRNHEELMAELDAVRQINRASRRCVKENESEPEWNNAVHGRLLRLALKSDSQVGFRYMYVNLSSQNHVQQLTALKYNSQN